MHKKLFALLMVFALSGFVFGFSSPVDISNSGTGAMLPQVDTDSNGVVHAVWMQCSDIPDTDCGEGCYCEVDDPYGCDEYCYDGMHMLKSCYYGGEEGTCCVAPEPTPTPANECEASGAPLCNGDCPGKFDECTPYPDGTCKCINMMTACEDSPNCRGYCGMILAPPIKPTIKPLPSEVCAQVGEFEGTPICACVDYALCGEGDDEGVCHGYCSSPGTYCTGLMILDGVPPGGMCGGSDPTALYSPPTMCWCAPWSVMPPISFHVFTQDEGSWQERDVLHYGMDYTTQTSDLTSFLSGEGTYQVRLVHEGENVKGFIDSVYLEVDGELYAPKKALMNGESALPKVIGTDYDVLHATLETVDLEWNTVPGASSIKLVLTAREESAEELEAMGGEPLYYPAPPWRGEAYSTYFVGSEFEFTDYWAPESGHPSGEIIGVMSSDSENLYLHFDAVPDNTRDSDSDFAKLEVKTESGEKEFVLTDTDSTYGQALFEYNENAVWEHRVYEFAIPLSELGVSDGDAIYFRLSGYGTMLVIPDPPIFCDDPNQVWEVMYSKKEGSSWSAPISLSDSPVHSMFPVIAVDSEDELLVAWKEYNNDPPEVFYVDSTTGGDAWSGPGQVNNAHIDANELGIAASGEDVGLTWEVGGNIEFADYDNCAWSATDTIDGSGSASEPAIHLAPGGGFQIAYARGNDIYCSGAGFAHSPFKLNTPAGASESPDLAVGYSGWVQIVWRDANQSDGSLPGHWEIWTARTDCHSTIEDMTVISNTPHYDSLSPRITVDSDHDYHVVWADAEPGNYDIYYSLLDGGWGTDWTEPLDISNTNAYSESPLVEADSNNLLHVIWGDQSPGNVDLFWTGYNGESWEAKEDLSNSGGSSAAHQLTIDNSNKPHIVYHDNTPGHFEVYYLGGTALEEETCELDLTVTNNCTNEDILLEVTDDDGHPVANVQVLVSFFELPAGLWLNIGSETTNASGLAVYATAEEGYYKFTAGKPGCTGDVESVYIEDCATPTPAPTATSPPSQPTPTSPPGPGPTPTQAPPSTPTPGGQTPSATPSGTSAPPATPTPRPTLTPTLPPGGCLTDADCTGVEVCLAGSCTELSNSSTIIHPADPGKPKIIVDMPMTVEVGQELPAYVYTENGAPVRGVKVTGFGEEKVTGQNGRVLFTPTQAGDYEVSFEKQGYPIGTRMVSVQGGGGACCGVFLVLAALGGVAAVAGAYSKKG